MTERGRPLTTLPAPRFSVVGFDVSSTAVDLVCLDENSDRAEWAHIVLPGATPFDRVRAVAGLMPQPAWYEERGVYLVGIEKPKSRFYASLAAQLPVFGAVIASLPDELLTYELPPWEWRQAVGLAGNATKADVCDWAYAKWFLGTDPSPIDSVWPLTQDAWDAYTIAYAARTLNRRGIEKKLAAAG